MEKRLDSNSSDVALSHGVVEYTVLHMDHATADFDDKTLVTIRVPAGEASFLTLCTEDFMDALMGHDHIREVIGKPLDETTIGQINEAVSDCMSISEVFEQWRQAIARSLPIRGRTQSLVVLDELAFNADRCYRPNAKPIASELSGRSAGDLISRLEQLDREQKERREQGT